MLHPSVPRSCAARTSGWPPTRSSTTSLSLGVTAVELLPVHQFVNDRHLVERGLTNYWGYNSIGFFAPDARYAAGGARHAGERVQVDGEGAAPRRASR